MVQSGVACVCGAWWCVWGGIGHGVCAHGGWCLRAGAVAVSALACVFSRVVVCWCVRGIMGVCGEPHPPVTPSTPDVVCPVRQPCRFFRLPNGFFPPPYRRAGGLGWVGANRSPPGGGGARGWGMRAGRDVVWNSVECPCGFMDSLWRCFQRGVWVDMGRGGKSRLGVNFGGANGSWWMGWFRGMAERLHKSTENAFSSWARVGIGVGREIAPVASRSGFKRVCASSAPFRSASFGFRP